MSKNLEKVIQRAISDAAFRRQLQSDPEAALRGFKLTESEVAALRSGDAGRLTSLGIDQRMSKTFSFGGDSLASRAAIGGDLTSGAGMSNAGNDPRMDAALEGGNTSGATRNVIPTEASGSSPAFDPGVTGNATSVGDPMFDGRATSVIADPDNPASARTYTGGQAAPTSDALEDQSHAFAASRSTDVAGSSGGSVIADPDNPAFARGYTGEQASAATASSIGDPDNPGSARTFTGGQTASSSDAMEDQSHAFAATRSADVAASGQAAPLAGTPEEFAFRDQGLTASSIGDPDNPANARGYIGDLAAAPTSDALEDQSHVIASRADAFLSEGEVSQYADPNLSSDQAEDAGHAFNPDSATLPDDGGTATQHHEPDVPS